MTGGFFTSSLVPAMRSLLGHPDTWTQQKFEFCCVIKGGGANASSLVKLVVGQAMTLGTAD